MGGWLKKTAKKATKVAKGVTKTSLGGRSLLGKAVFKAASRAVDNIKDKGIGALTAGQIGGADSAKETARNEAEAQAAADASAVIDKAAADAAAIKAESEGKDAANKALRLKMGLGAPGEVAQQAAPLQQAAPVAAPPRTSKLKGKIFRALRGRR